MHDTDPTQVPFPPELAALRDHVRSAHVPITGDGDDEGPVSKLVGRPWLPAGTEWPRCPSCERPLQLFLQLDLADLPKGAPGGGRGLAQLFYCTNSEPLCEVNCEAYSPFADSVVARLVDPHGPGATAPEERAHEAFPAAVIRGWTETWDLPNREELIDIGAGDEDDELPDETEETIHAARRPVAGDKLGGWPYWVQGVEYPSCLECGETMQLLFQIDSNHNLPFMFGDTGCAHLTQCPHHPEVLAFGWACC
ncbi:MAG: DUF1963 domain-containing protein [Nannocystaceae bacterium]